MSSGEESSPVVENVVEVFKYGDEGVQDVVLIVGTREFHVNRMFLAARSSYFSGLFLSNFKEKTQDRVNIETDEVAFKRMMDLLYFNRFEGDFSFIQCHVVSSIYVTSVTADDKAWAQKFWSESLAILQVCDRFDVTGVCLPLFECILFFNMCPANTNACMRCANRMLLALHTDMTGFKARTTFDAANIVVCLKNFHEYIPNLNIQGKDLPLFCQLLGK